jgi:hypothetical protein
MAFCLPFALNGHLLLCSYNVLHLKQEIFCAASSYSMLQCNRSQELVTFLHSESDISSFLLCGQEVAFATLPGILAFRATVAKLWLSKKS